MKQPRDVAKEGICSDGDLNRKFESILQRLMKQPVGSLSRPQSHSRFLRTLTCQQAVAHEVKPSAAGRCIPAACNEKSSFQATIKAYGWFVQAAKLAWASIFQLVFASQKLVTWHLTLLWKGEKAEETQTGQKAFSEVQRIGGFKLSWASNNTMALHFTWYLSQCASQVDPNKLEICPGSRQATSAQRTQHVQTLDDKIEIL